VYRFHDTDLAGVGLVAEVRRQARSGFRRARCRREPAESVRVTRQRCSRRRAMPEATAPDAWGLRCRHPRGSGAAPGWFGQRIPGSAFRVRDGSSGAEASVTRWWPSDPCMERPCRRPDREPATGAAVSTTHNRRGRVGGVAWSLSDHHEGVAVTLLETPWPFGASCPMRSTPARRAATDPRRNCLDRAAICRATVAGGDSRAVSGIFIQATVADPTEVTVPVPLPLPGDANTTPGLAGGFQMSAGAVGRVWRIWSEVWPARAQ